ncbi:MAG: dTDP-glucose 4,6-dehydratase [bacterium]
MRKRFHKLIVTGGAGFIGSEFVRKFAGKYRIIVVDKLTYAADLKRLEGVKGKFRFYKVDICAAKKISEIFRKEKPDAVVHFAAESHVDRSIEDASPFMKTNVLGTQVLLDAARKHNVKKFCHISTDEIYGEIKKGKFSENSPFAPNSPYSASKAAGDMLARAYYRTYHLPVVIARPSNNYGPWQFPEKLIPVIIQNALVGRKVPVYAQGENVREWLYVSDCAEAILRILEKGKIGEAYNVGSGHEERNIDVVKGILKILGKPQGLIAFVKDRPGHDFRYSLNTAKIRAGFGWLPETKFPDGLRKTVGWYVKNRGWIKSVLDAG